MPNSMGNLMLWIQHNISESERLLAYPSDGNQSRDEPFVLSLEKIPIPVMMINKQGNVTRTNSAFHLFYGLNGSELIEESLLYSPQEYSRIFDQLELHPYIQREAVITTNYGETRWVQLHFSRMDYEVPDALLLTITDQTTLRNQAERISREYEEIKLLADSVTDAIYLINLQGCIEWQNKGARSMLGYKDQHMIGQPFSKIVPGMPLWDVSGDLGNDSSMDSDSDLIENQEATVLNAKGENIPVTVWMRRKQLMQRFIYVVILRERSSERDHILSVSHLRDLFQREIAQDLHDSIGGLLSGITMIGEQVLKQIHDDNRPIKEKVHEVVNLVKEADELTHLLAKGMMREGQLEGGLHEALERLCHRTSKLFNVNCSFCSSTREVSLLKEPAGELFSIAQEAVGNAIRHGHANEIQVRLELFHDSLRLCVEDNGIGLTITNGSTNGLSGEHAESSGQTPHHLGGLGLRIMRRRAILLGGKFNLTRTGDHKTRAECTIPLLVQASGLTEFSPLNLQNHFETIIQE